VRVIRVAIEILQVIPVLQLPDPSVVGAASCTQMARPNRS
jgi:hypothetical protein